MDIKEDRPAYVKFERRAVEDRDATIKNGRYTTKDVDMAKITPPYSKDVIEQFVPEWLDSMEQNVRAGRLPEMWRDKYVAAYNAWKLGQEIPEDGTPIKGWAMLSPSQAANMIAIGVRTVEDLAKINDEGMKRYGMGALDLKNKAMAWLKSVSGPGKIAQENAALKAQVETLTAEKTKLVEQMNALAARLDTLERKAA
jgi:hypothetical protein